MISHQVDITIQRPIEEVFAFLTDPKNHSRWDTTSISMEQLEPGPWREGTRFREIRKLGRRNVEVASQVAALEPNRRFNIMSLSGPEWRGQWLFDEVEKGTRLRFEGRLTFTGAMRLMEPLIARGFKRQIDENFARLKEILERGN
jgi:uncharacterized protein YndB with AHSA1/START domain